MTHWIHTYPHTIYASVLLVNNKIYDWKVGQNYWDERDLRIKDGTVNIESTSWEVNSSEEHDQVFTIHAKEWMKQWDIHEDYNGFYPY